MALLNEERETFTAGATDATRTPFRVSMRDAAQLHGTEYRVNDGTAKRSTLPLLCLPSDLGNALEFDRLARALLALENGPSRIICPSFRGRGLSDKGDEEAYSPLTAAEDLICVCDALGIHHAAALANGGGLVTALLAAPKRPGLFQASIFNDAAPEQDGVGIARLRTLSGNAAPGTLDEAITQEKNTLGAMFPAFSDDDWREKVSPLWRDDKTPAHDKKLAALYDATDYGDRQPTYWEEFALFASRPLLLVRGENSPLVSEDIIARMREKAPDLQVETASGQGHFPALTREPLPARIATFLKSA